MTHDKFHSKIRAPFSRRYLLPAILAATALLMLGCRQPATVDAPDQTTPAPKTATVEPTEPATPDATVTDVSTTVPADPPPATQTPATRTPEPTEEPTAASDRAGGPAVGARAPSLTLPDLDGDEVSLSDSEGSAVLLNFWTTW